MLSHFKLKPVCDTFGENTVWNLLNIHGWCATLLGWAHFTWGVFLYWGDVEQIREVMQDGFWYAAWTCSFLLAIHVYKNRK